MSVLISLDPGEHTGIAVFDELEQLVFAITDDSPFAFVESLTNQWLQTASIIAEEWPSKPTAGQEAVHRLLIAVEDRVTWVRPTKWKGTPNSRLTDRDDKLCTDKHQRDATMMGRWYLRTVSTNAPV